MLRARRIDLDQVATAYCWEEKLNLAKRPAMTQLVKELVIYLQELQDQHNDSSKASANEAKQTNNPDDDSSKKEGVEPSGTAKSRPGNCDAHAAHRISDLEAKLATALDTIATLQKPTASSTPPVTPKKQPGNTGAAPRTPPPNTHDPVHVADSAPENLSRGTKRPASPHMRETVLPTTTTQQDSADSTTEQQQKDKTTPEPNSLTGMHFPGKSLSGAKRQRQATLATGSSPTKRDPEMDPQQIFQQPPQQSTWFQEKLHRRLHRLWHRSMVRGTDKQRKHFEQYMEITTAAAFPTLTTAQQESLHTAAVAWGIPFKTIEKFSNPALVKLVAIISQMTE